MHFSSYMSLCSYQFINKIDSSSAKMYHLSARFFLQVNVSCQGNCPDLHWLSMTYLYTLVPAYLNKWPGGYVPLHVLLILTLFEIIWCPPARNAHNLTSPYATWHVTTFGDCWEGETNSYCLLLYDSSDIAQLTFSPEQPPVSSVLLKEDWGALCKFTVFCWMWSEIEVGGCAF
jgi:hypothetical protein